MSEPRAVIETISPAMAAAFLRTMLTNRTLNQSRALEMAIAMDEGRWSLNGETVKFDSAGHMIDGQHRMQACILSGKPFQTWIIRGLADPRAKATIDTGGVRTPAHVFQFANIKNSNLVAGASRLMYWHDARMLSCPQPRYRLPEKFKLMMQNSGVSATSVKPASPSKDELLAYLKKHEAEIDRAVTMVDGKRAARVLTPSIAVACAALFSRLSVEDAAMFFEDLGSGAQLRDDDPVFVLREKMLTRSNAQTRFNTMAIMFFTFKAWNKRRQHRPSKTLKMALNEEFPKLI